LSHQVCRNPEEMNATVPLASRLPRQSEVDFMNEGCSLKRMIGPLPRQLIRRHTSKLTIDDGNEL